MILLRHGESHFNVVFSKTRVDPGIVDPGLTDEGIRQAEAAAAALAGRGLRRIMTSPYTRTLHTAEIAAEVLGLPVEVEPLVRERCFFVCDIGSPRSELIDRWGHFDFGELPERWWPEPDETEAELAVRCQAFRDDMAQKEDWRYVLVVSHWGFIRGLTGEAVTNATAVAFQP